LAKLVTNAISRHNLYQQRNKFSANTPFEGKKYEKGEEKKGKI
jgi:hypothetical protein